MIPLVADFSGVESEALTIAALAGEMVFSGGATRAAVACGMALHSKSFAGISGKDPPMVKSATDQ